MASCQRCNISEKCKYWHEFSPTKHKFSTIMSEGFEHELTIPSKFVGCFRGKLSRSCSLKGPSGNVWSVKIRREPEVTLFSEGWEQFARDHGLKDKDHLVFSYAGDSCFAVSMFDETGCEKESSYFAKNVRSSSCMACRSTLHARVNNGSRGKRPSESDEDQDSTFDMFEAEEEEEEEEAHLRTSGSSSSRAKQYHSYYVSNRRMVTEEEKKMAKHLADVYVFNKEYTGVPMVTIKMLPSHVYSGFHLTIPKKWALEHMIPIDHMIELYVQGSKVMRWIVQCRWIQTKQCQLHSGWSKFVLDNNLEEHDVCVFELVQKKAPMKQNPIFHVQIFRVVAEVTPLTLKKRNM